MDGFGGNFWINVVIWQNIDFYSYFLLCKQLGLVDLMQFFKLVNFFGMMQCQVDVILFVDQVFFVESIDLEGYIVVIWLNYGLGL